MAQYRSVTITIYKASVNTPEYPYAYIEVQDEKLREKWVKSYQSSHGKNAPVLLSERLIEIREEVKEEKQQKGDTA